MQSGTDDRKHILIVDDDVTFAETLARALDRRGMHVTHAQSVSSALNVISERPPHFAVVDLKVGSDSGLIVIEHLREVSPTTRAVIFTGYGNLETAVTAVKLGAIDYLAKPADVDELLDALTCKDRLRPPPPKSPMNPDQVRLEHIRAEFERNNKNVSETARRLQMHRRTLQRILGRIEQDGESQESLLPGE